MGAMKTNPVKVYWDVLKEAVSRFISEDTFTQSAALSYYTVFSLPPMLFIIFWSAGLLFDEAAIRTAVFDELGKMIGSDGSDQLLSTIEGINLHKPGWWESLIGIVTMLITSSTVFIAMQSALNRIFEVQINRSLKQSIWVMIRDRILSLSILAIIAFIMAVSLVITTTITQAGSALEAWFGEITAWLVFLDFILLNLAVLTVLFAVMFRYLPDVQMKWRNTWFGAFFTALLFLGGKSLIAIFIGNSEVANFYEAAGSILVLMLWVYYASAIFLFGATITHCRAVQLEASSHA